MPIYFDPVKNALVPVPYKVGDALISGCSCAARGKKCTADPKCRCKDKIKVAGDEPCTRTRCKACKRDPHGCAVRAGCECRRNALPDRVFVCNELCHAQKGRGCGQKVRYQSGFAFALATDDAYNQYTVTPREKSVEIVEHSTMGHGACFDRPDK